MAQGYFLGEPAAEEPTGTVERGDRGFQAAAAERHDECGRVLKVGAEPDLGDGQIEIGERRITQFAASEDARQRVAQLLADPKLPVARRLAAARGYPNVLVQALSEWPGLRGR